MGFQLLAECIVGPLSHFAEQLYKRTEIM